MLFVRCLFAACRSLFLNCLPVVDWHSVPSGYPLKPIYADLPGVRS